MMLRLSYFFQVVLKGIFICYIFLLYLVLTSILCNFAFLMKSFLSIGWVFLFSFQALVPNMDICCEIPKIPNLLDHYEEHKACNDDSFWKFLVNEYLNFGDDSKGHHDDSDHEGLPFHSNHKCCCTSAFYASDQSFSLAIFEFSPQTEFGYYTSFHPSEFPDSPFQPPQV